MQQPQEVPQSRYALVRWIRARVSAHTVLKSLLALAIYDILPGALIIRYALYVYAATKVFYAQNAIKERIKQSILATKRYLDRFWVSLGATWANWVNYYKENPQILGKGFLSVFFIANTYSTIATLA